MSIRLTSAIFGLSLCLSSLTASVVVANPLAHHLNAQTSANTADPNSTDGLHQLVADMLDAQRKGGSGVVSKYLPALVLPDSSGWFQSAFGNENGGQLAVFYDAWASFRNSQLSGDLARAVAAQMTQIEVLRLEKPGDPGTTDKDDYFLGLRQEPEPFYVVNFRSAGGASMRWAYFIFADGAFRYLGELPDLRVAAKVGMPSENQPSPQLARRIRVGGNEMAARIVHQVSPIYPADAVAAHVEGTVLLHATISGNGDVQELQFISGPPLLMRAAMDAVRQWKYSPFLLNGRPVEVDTSITVQFSLRSSSATETPASSAPSNAPAKTASAATPAASIPSYPDSAGGLTKMMKEMLDMAKKDDNQGLGAYYQALVLPNSGSWFPAQFGADPGAQFAQSYRLVSQTLSSFFTNTIESDPNLQSSYVQVRRFKSSCDSDANEFEYPLLLARENQTLPLYEVRFIKGTGFYWLFPFVYEESGFRYLGDLRIQAPQNHILVPRSSEDSSGGVQMPKLIKEVQAVFPMGYNPRNAGIVKLWGVIATDGSVKNLHVIEGTCDFAKATIDAVKKWRYTPLMVNGKPQEVYYPFQYSFGPSQ